MSRVLIVLGSSAFSHLYSKHYARTTNLPPEVDDRKNFTAQFCLSKWQIKYLAFFHVFDPIGRGEVGGAHFGVIEKKAHTRTQAVHYITVH